MNRHSCMDIDNEITMQMQKLHKKAPSYSHDEQFSDAFSPSCDILAQLHDDIWVFMMMNDYFAASDLCRLSSVCRKMNALTNMERVWKHMCEDEWGHLLDKAKKERKCSWKTLYSECYMEGTKLQKDKEAEGLTPLQAAACVGNHKAVTNMVRTMSTEDVNKTSPTGRTPLYMSADRGFTRVVSTLLHAQGSVNQPETTMGATPMYVAAFDGHTDVVKMLLSARANINAPTTHGATPLYVASQNGHIDTVRTLLANGGMVNQLNVNDVGPLYVATQNGHLDIVDLLVSKGAYVNQANVNGATPLFIAAQHGHYNIVEFLLKNGAGVNQAKKDGTTPLYIAAEKGHAPTINALLSRGANVNMSIHQDSATPLFIAAQNGHVETVRLLLAKGANKHISWKGSISPLQIAQQMGQKEIVAMLQDRPHA